MAVGDFNADGKPDVAVANFNLDQLTNGDSVSVLIGNGDGTFQPAANYVVGAHPIAVVITDFDGNGKADIAVANNSDDTVSVLRGNGDGTFQTPVTYPSGVGPHSLAAADFNGDGKVDLAIANVRFREVVRSTAARPVLGPLAFCLETATAHFKRRFP